MNTDKYNPSLPFAERVIARIDDLTQKEKGLDKTMKRDGKDKELLKAKVRNRNTVSALMKLL